MSKRRKNLSQEDFSRDREELREISRFSRVERSKRWKFDKNNFDKYFEEDYEEEIDDRR
jgi:hypothetical protein